VRPIVDSRDGSKPLVAFLVPEAPQALALLTAAGVPNFRTPEACADAIAAAFGRRAPRELPARPAGMAAASADGGRMLDELQAYALLERIGVPHAPVMAIDVGQALPPVPLDYPLAVKVLHADIAHKTDVGGVVLGVADRDGLSRAVQTIAQEVAARRAGTTVDRVLAQSMVRGLGEVLIGYRVDAEAGPLVMLAAGGVLTEIYRDRSLRMAPVDLDTARGMIAEVKALQALSGYRGKPPGDLDALAAAIVALSGLALLDDVQVAEAEINPLIVRAAGQGVIAVDALVRLA
jgi:acyl-CoA synthetase (NDP forming)